MASGKLMVLLFLMNPVFGQMIYILIVYDLKTRLIIITLL